MVVSIGNMVLFISKFYSFKHVCRNTWCIKIFKRNYLENIATQRTTKGSHPYKRIHPWKSLQDFSEDLLKNVVYNKDGLVALNKPYGIRRRNHNETENDNFSRVPGGVEYALEDSLPYISDQLNYDNLTIVRCPEMYTSGVALLAANGSVENEIVKSIRRTHFFACTYWVTTIGVPKQKQAEHRLGIRLISNPNYDHQKAIIETSWSKQDEKNKRIKLLKIDYEVLSNSTHNLCSLIKIKSSTQKRHAIRLFTSTFLYCPILGDNVCSAMIQKVGDTYVKVDPFLTCAGPPKLDMRILKLLEVHPRQRLIIPVHIHLRSMSLPKFFGEDLTIEAPLMPEYEWTCKQLEFKYFTQENKLCT